MAVNNYHNRQTDQLVKAFLNVHDEEECYKLMEDLMTFKEIQDLGQRLEVAVMLRQKITYTKIAESTGVSTATISRVNRALSYGSGGYDMILDRLEQEK